MLVVLPLPPREVSPNARVHWAKKARAAKRYKISAELVTEMAIKEQGYPEGLGEFMIHPIFYFPVRRRRDRDNLLASLKSAFDGVAQAMDIDDSQFAYVSPTIEYSKDDPRVELLVRR